MFIKKQLSQWLAYLLLVISICYTPSHANETFTPDRLELFTNQANQSPYISFYRDSTRQLSLEQVKTPEIFQKFRRTSLKQSTFDRSQDAYWFIFDVRTHVQLNSLHLINSFPAGTHSELFIEELPQHTLSNNYSSQHLAIPEYHLFLKGNQYYRFYIRALHKRDIMRVQFTFMPHEVAVKRSTLSTIALTFLASGFLIVVLYNVLLSFSLHEKSYLNIALFAFVIAVDIICKRNLFPWIPFLGQFGEMVYPVLGLTVIITTLNFIPYILSDQLSSPLVKKLFYAIKILCIVLMPIAIVHPQGDAISFWIGFIIIAPLTFLSIYSSFYLNTPLARKGFVMVLILSISWPTVILSETGITEKLPYTDALRYGGCLIAAIFATLVQAAQAKLFQQQAAQATALNKAKDEFLSTITHELRTPMQSVVGIAELLQQGELNQTQKQHTQQLLTASDHMLSLIDDILDLSRLENAKTELHPAPFHLEQLANSLEILFSSPAQQKGLSFQIQADNKLGIYMLGDEKRIKQVLVNVIGNAIKYTDQGLVTLSIKTKVKDKYCHTSFDIHDTGIGISEADQQRLFDAFYQAKRGRSRRYTGTGLGLSISQQLLSHMDSQLHVKSKIGRGSHFYFTLILPTTLPPSSNTQEKVLDHNGLKSYKLLIVDDDVINANLSKAMLSKFGASINIAFSGAMAIQQIEQENFDLIFMDISMPDMDGYETTRHIRRLLQHNTYPPIIALTAHAMSGERERCIEAGMDDYLTKPFTSESIVNMALRWIQH